MKFLLIGQGKMGKLIASTAEAAGDEIVGAYHRENLSELSGAGRIADAVIDFSRPETLPAVEEYIRRTGTPLISGTTGYTDEEMRRLLALGDCAPVLWAANYSIGVAVFYRLLTQISDTLKPDFDIEMTETHHNQKVDAPSGTAHMLFQAIQQVRPQATEHCGRAGEGKRTKEEVGVSSLRLAGIVGIHEIHICTPTQQLVLRHEAFDRGMFADGAVEAAAFLAGKQPGIYNMENLLG